MDVWSMANILVWVMFGIGVACYVGVRIIDAKSGKRQ